MEDSYPILPAWKPERAYYKGYSEDRNICLYYKDGNTHKMEKITNFPFYFLITYDDYVLHRESFKKALEKRMIMKLSKHHIEGHNKWVRVYVNKIHKRNFYFNTYSESGEYNKLENIENIVAKLEQAGIQCYEADVTPLHRFLADHQVNIDTKLERCYLDIETDDTKGGFDEESLKKNRILSYAWFNDQGQSKFEISKSNDDKGEKELLMKMYNDVKKFDIMCAWNGANFDFKVIRYRMQAHDIKAWNTLEHQILHSDLLEASKRNAPSGEFKSFALGNVGEKVCGLKKIEHTGLKIIDLWTSHKDKLKEYNLRDAEIMYKVEKAKAYQQNDIRTAALGHRFCNYFNISGKVEGALLYEANRRGIHYPTVKKRVHETYEGGWVQEPIRGMYDNVATLDFSSLYPSIISTYNVSHDVVLTRAEADEMDPADVISTPASAKAECWFRKDKIGLIPELLQHLNKERHRFEKLKDKCEHGSDEYWYNYWAAAVHKTYVLSFYGALGDSKARFFDKRLARTITLCGQFYIKYVAALADKRGNRSLYQDTDSIFLQIKEGDIQGFLDYVHEAFNKVNDKFNCFPGFMKLNYENYYTRAVFLKKKRYGGCLKIHKGKEVKDFINVRGLETRRSDIPDIAKNVLNETMKMLFVERRPKEDFVKMMKEIRTKIEKNNVTRDELLIYKQVSKPFSEYEGSIMDKKTGKPKVKKDGTIQKKAVPLHVQIAKRLVRRGKEFYTGSQIPFIVTGTGPLEGVHESEYKKGEYDKSYYFDTQVYEPSKRILECAFPDFNWDSLYIDAKAAAKVKEDDDE